MASNSTRLKSKLRSGGTLIDILGTEADDIIDKVQVKNSKIYKNLDVLEDREKEVVIGRFGLEHGGLSNA